MQASSSNAFPVPLLDVSRSNDPIRQEVLELLANVYDSGRFLFGPQVAELEKVVADICNAKHAIGCASGSDALLLALMALDIQPGDEIIVPSFTFFATASCVQRLGAKIVFADIDPRTFNISVEDIVAKITRRTRAIIPVHLFGQPAQIDAICSVADRHNIAVVEDGAQAIGAAYHGRPVCSWGQIGCLSFYPTKNLGGFGDGGMLTAQSESVADRLRLLAAHGMKPRYYHSEIGINSRLDTFQAAALLVKAKRLAGYTSARQENACRYFELFEQTGLTDSGAVVLPYSDPAAYHVWNQFSLRVPAGRRDGLRAYLTQQQIGTEVYYPVPLHQQICFRFCGYASGSLPHSEQAAAEILNLPIFPELTIREQSRVVGAIAEHFATAVNRAAA